jgi:mono/diheme cytochrome c family protein
LAQLASQDRPAGASAGRARHCTERISMPLHRSGCVLALAAVAMLACTVAGAQENLDAGKTAQKLFTESCAACHRSAKGLAKGRFSFTLYLYLQKHYASNSSSAWALTSYLESVDAGKRGPTRAAAAATTPARTSSTWTSHSPLRPPAPVSGR